MTIVYEGREPPGWVEVDPVDRELALAALRRAVFAVLDQRVPPGEAFAVVGEMVGKYADTEHRAERESLKSAIVLGLNPGGLPKLRRLRRLSQEERTRFRNFVNQSDWQGAQT